MHESQICYHEFHSVTLKAPLNVSSCFIIWWGHLLDTKMHPLEWNGYSLWIQVLVLRVRIDHADELHAWPLYWKWPFHYITLKMYDVFITISLTTLIIHSTMQRHKGTFREYKSAKLPDLLMECTFGLNLLLICTLLTTLILIYQLLCLSTGVIKNGFPADCSITLWRFQK